MWSEPPTRGCRVSSRCVSRAARVSRRSQALLLEAAIASLAHGTFGRADLADHSTGTPIMVSTRVAIGKLIHALEVWSDDPRLPNIEPLQHEPSTADSTAIQRCIGQYSDPSLCTRGVVLYCNTALYILQLYSALHSTALYTLQRSTIPLRV